MTPDLMQQLVTVRLEHLAQRVQDLILEGEHDLAAFVRAEGLELAKAYDDGYAFFYINDLKHAR